MYRALRASGHEFFAFRSKCSRKTEITALFYSVLFSMWCKMLIVQISPDWRGPSFTALA
jgi:hypothetical protein